MRYRRAMPRKPAPKWDDPEESKRFLDTAKAVEASDDPKDFDARSNGGLQWQAARVTLGSKPLRVLLLPSLRRSPKRFQRLSISATPSRDER